MTTLASLLAKSEYLDQEVEELNAYMVSDHFLENKDRSHHEVMMQYTNTLLLRNAIRVRIEGHPDYVSEKV